MTSLSPTLQFFLDIARVQAVMARRFDNKLGGLGFSEFIILLHLQASSDEKVRRVDLAEKVGLTASGITRLLLPMEKVGLIKREAEANDARVSYVLLAPGGKRRLEEALERAEVLMEDLVPAAEAKGLKAMFTAFAKFGESIV